MGNITQMQLRSVRKSDTLSASAKNKNILPEEFLVTNRWHYETGTNLY